MSLIDKWYDKRQKNLEKIKRGEIEPAKEKTFVNEKGQRITINYLPVSLFLSYKKQLEIHEQLKELD